LNRFFCVYGAFLSHPDSGRERAMSQAPFTTDNYDLALTMVGEGFDVRYTGPHQGVFRFESVKLAALMTLPPEMRPPLPPALYADFQPSQPSDATHETLARGAMKPAG
jgi:hypothetical protein